MQKLHQINLNPDFFQNTSMLQEKDRHKKTWCSSHYYGGLMVSNLLMFIAIALSGLTYESASLMLKFANIAHGCSRTYFRYQKIIAKVVK